jgi:flagellar hook-associated protein 1 FlgK
VPSLGTLNIAYTGLNTHQQRLGVISENIANINTPGYHRQNAVLEAIQNSSRGLHGGDLHRGGGVELSEITRIRSRTLGDHARRQGAVAGQATAEAEIMRQLETEIGGLNAGGIHEQMTDLFNAFDDLAGSPNDQAMRQVVLQRADIVAQGFNRTTTSIDDLRNRTVEETEDAVRTINSLAQQVADMDAEILGATTAGSSANSLLDKRDLILDELSAVADVTITPTIDGQVTVALDGHVLVSNGRARTIEVTHQPDAALGALGYSRVAVTNSQGRELTVRSGSLKGQLDALNVTIPDVRTRVTDAALALVDQVNPIHAGGFGLDNSTGLPMFDLGPGPGEISVSAAIAGQPDRVAAAALGAGPLDNSNMRALAQLADDPNGPLTHFVDMVGGLAAEVANAESRSEATTVAKANADALATAQSGVNLDEELTDLLSAQRAYEASARVLTAVDEMLQSLMSVGLVGR